MSMNIVFYFTAAFLGNLSKRWVFRNSKKVKNHCLSLAPFSVRFSAVPHPLSKFWKNNGAFREILPDRTEPISDPYYRRRTNPPKGKTIPTVVGYPRGCVFGCNTKFSVFSTKSTSEWDRYRVTTDLIGYLYLFFNQRRISKYNLCIFIFTWQRE